MKRIIYLLLCASLAQGFVACDTVDFGDKNENRNGATELSPAGLMSGAMMSYATAGGRDYLKKPTLYVQYQSQVTYTDEMLYSSAPSTWYTYYVDVLANLDRVIKYNQDPANQGAALNAQGSPANQIGVAMIMKAIVIKRVTDTWGDVPYSDAFKGLDGISPKYDKQEDIYKTLIKELKEGRDMLDASKNQPTGDIIYKGNVTKWKKLANSVLLQATLQLSERFPSPSGYAATEFKSALNHSAGVIDEVSEEAWFEYEDVTGFRNPWNVSRTRDYFMSGEFVDALQGDPKATSLNPTSSTTPDARIEVYAKSKTAEGVPYGHSDGSGKGGKNQVSTKYYWNDTTPLPMMTASYTYLNRAEAAQLGWSTEVAAEMLEKGIKLSFESLEQKTGQVITDEADAYATARLADVANVGMLQVIGEEKWKALFGMAFDAWSEFRRTGYPALKPARDYQNAGKIPTRYLYPSEEPNLNGTNYRAAISGLNPGEDQNTAKVWWDIN
jgi:hypothetical protein